MKLTCNIEDIVLPVQQRVMRIYHDTYVDSTHMRLASRRPENVGFRYYPSRRIHIPYCATKASSFLVSRWVQDLLRALLQGTFIE